MASHEPMSARGTKLRTAGAQRGSGSLLTERQGVVLLLQRLELVGHKPLHVPNAHAVPLLREKARVSRFGRNAVARGHGSRAIRGRMLHRLTNVLLSEISPNRNTAKCLRFPHPSRQLHVLGGGGG